ncbi:MAG: hypothetical protein JXR48_13045, partial [Candidatus Delongbacteria bacterium]|nr:hypothetical protein [Candidatus Delongbacteria bacterium]MBN2835880.1 hypothetical protein [Candidatus Delongbacteria bacterium]
MNVKHNSPAQFLKKNINLKSGRNSETVNSKKVAEVVSNNKSYSSNLKSSSDSELVESKNEPRNGLKFTENYESATVRNPNVEMFSKFDKSNLKDSKQSTAEKSINFKNISNEENSKEVSSTQLHNLNNTFRTTKNTSTKSKIIASNHDKIIPQSVKFSNDSDIKQDEILTKTNLSAKVKSESFLSNATENSDNLDRNSLVFNDGKENTEFKFSKKTVPVYGGGFKFIAEDSEGIVQKKTWMNKQPSEILSFDPTSKKNIGNTKSNEVQSNSFLKESNISESKGLNSENISITDDLGGPSKTSKKFVDGEPKTQNLKAPIRIIANEISENLIFNEDLVGENPILSGTKIVSQKFRNSDQQKNGVFSKTINYSEDSGNTKNDQSEKRSFSLDREKIDFQEKKYFGQEHVSDKYKSNETSQNVKSKIVDRFTSDSRGLDKLLGNKTPGSLENKKSPDISNLKTNYNPSTDKSSQENVDIDSTKIINSPNLTLKKNGNKTYLEKSGINDKKNNENLFLQAKSEVVDDTKITDNSQNLASSSINRDDTKDLKLKEYANDYGKKTINVKSETLLESFHEKSSVSENSQNSKHHLNNYKHSVIKNNANTFFNSQLSKDRSEVVEKIENTLTHKSAKDFSLSGNFKSEKKLSSLKNSEFHKSNVNNSSIYVNSVEAENEATNLKNSSPEKQVFRNSEKVKLPNDVEVNKTYFAGKENDHLKSRSSIKGEVLHDSATVRRSIDSKAQNSFIDKNEPLNSKNASFEKQLFRDTEKVTLPNDVEVNKTYFAGKENDHLKSRSSIRGEVLHDSTAERRSIDSKAQNSFIDKNEPSNSKNANFE